jgi:O-antigen ligase
LAFLALLIASYYLDFTQFSSGRTSVYAERIDLISARPLATLLFGTGAGTDLVVSSAWWWDAKNSHNDFLSVLYERGLLGFLSLLAVFWSLIFISSKTTPLALAIFSASIISNGLLARPLAFFIYALIVSLSLRDITDDAMNKHTQSFRL